MSEQFLLGQTLPDAPNLEQQHKLAKNLLKAAKDSSQDALRLIADYHPQASTVTPDSVKLADIQLAYARRFGFASWPIFQREIAAAQVNPERILQFLESSTSGKTADAKQILRNYPGVTKISAACAAVAGDVPSLRQLIDKDSNVVNTVSGTERRTPISWACFSHLIHDKTYQPGILDAVKLLIDRGGNPNDSFITSNWPDYPFSCLYGAAGVLFNPELTKILLDAGANPNDHESLYHSLEKPGNECTALLLKYGVKIRPTDLFHQLDIEDIAGLQRLLDHGADPNLLHPDTSVSPLYWAIERKRSTAIIQLLIEKGADVHFRSPDGVSLFQLATHCGMTQVAELLGKYGADQELSKTDRIIHAAKTANLNLLHELIKQDSPARESATIEGPKYLIQSAQAGDNAAVNAFLEWGVPIDSRGEGNATALHWAAWYGNPDTVSLLIEKGADIEVKGTDYSDANPLQWAFHGSGNNRQLEHDQGRYIAVIDALLAAGSSYDPCWLQMANEQVQRHFANLGK